MNSKIHENAHQGIYDVHSLSICMYHSVLFLQSKFAMTDWLIELKLFARTEFSIKTVKSHHKATF